MTYWGHWAEWNIEVLLGNKSVFRWRVELHGFWPLFRAPNPPKHGKLGRRQLTEEDAEHGSSLLHWCVILLSRGFVHVQLCFEEDQAWFG